jgi:hypothetical protein
LLSIEEKDWTSFDDILLRTNILIEAEAKDDTSLVKPIVLASWLPVKVRLDRDISIAPAQLSLGPSPLGVRESAMVVLDSRTATAFKVSRIDVSGENISVTEAGQGSSGQQGFKIEKVITRTEDTVETVDFYIERPPGRTVRRRLLINSIGTTAEN